MKSKAIHWSLRLATGLPIALLVAACDNDPKPGPDPKPIVDSTIVEAMPKPVIYQMLTRLFGNKEMHNKTYGTLEENGVGKFGDINEAALNSLKQFGVTHVWYTGVIEHASMTAFPAASIPADDADVVKGRAGSPYAIKDYYDVTPLLAADPANRMAEFTQLIQRTHAAGLKVIIDFVPNHVARGYRSDARPSHVADLGETDDTEARYKHSNNFYYLPGETFQVPAGYNPLGAEKAPNEDGKWNEKPARVTGNNVFKAQPSVDDWFETVKLNYGIEYTDSGEKKHFSPVPETWTKMRDIILFWASKGVDGFRCDIAEMVPVEFWEWMIADVKKQHPALIFIAEIYNPSIYHDYVKRGGFDFLYDKVGVYDAVRAVVGGRAKVAQIDSALRNSAGIEAHMLRFLENHDEQRIASPDFSGDPWTGVPAMTVSACIGTGPVMMYFGQEVGEPGRGHEGFQGEDGRTTIFDFWGVPEHQKWMNNGRFDGGLLDSTQKRLRAFYSELLNLCRSNGALREGKLEPVASPAEQVYTFVRHLGTERVLVLAHFGRREATELALTLTAQDMEGIGMATQGDLKLRRLAAWNMNLPSETATTADALLTKGLKLKMPANSACILSF